MSSPCGHGNVCVNKQSRYQCKCLGGYSGANCEVPPDFCELNDCRNDATCTSHFSNYACHCLIGFTGTLCESEIGEIYFKDHCIRLVVKIKSKCNLSNSSLCKMLCTFSFFLKDIVIQ